MAGIINDGYEADRKAIEPAELNSAIDSNDNLQLQTVDTTKRAVDGSPSSNLGIVASDENARRERNRTMKNVILISVAFLFNFTSYGGLARLQSSLHQVE